MINRILGLDYGDRRIGVALSDGLGLTAQPYPFIPSDEHAIDRIQSLVIEYDVAEIVVGLPKHLDGRQSEKAAMVRNGQSGYINIPNVQSCFEMSDYQPLQLPER